MHGKTFSKTQLFKDAWAVYKPHIFSLALIYAATLLLLWFVRDILTQELTFSLPYSKELIWLVTFLVQSFITLGLVYMIVNIDHGRPPRLSDFIRKIDKFFPFTFLLLLISIIFYAGLFFGIAPGIIILSLFVLSPYIMISENASLLQSIKKSFVLSRKHILNILLLLLILYLMIFISALSIVALVFAVPFANLTIAKLYDTLQTAQDPKQAESILVEQRSSERLLVVLLILAIFAYGMFVFYKRFVRITHMAQMPATVNTQGKMAEMKIQKIQLALELYNDTYGVYPDELQRLVAANILSEKDITGFTYNLRQDSYDLCTANSNTCISASNIINRQ